MGQAIYEVVEMANGFGFTIAARVTVYDAPRCNDHQVNYTRLDWAGLELWM